jgi:predicted nucleic acid-binding protein
MMLEDIEQPLLRIYLDVCCLNRPFDDQRQDRIRLESEAVLLILGHCEAGTWQWISSAVVEEEVNNTPSHERRYRVRSMLSGAHSMVALTEAAVIRAQELKAMGFRTYDALHLACAEEATVNNFLPTDDCVLCIAASHAAELHIRVANPLTWLMEVR